MAEEFEFEMAIPEAKPKQSKVSLKASTFIKVKEETDQDETEEEQLQESVMKDEDSICEPEQSVHSFEGPLTSKQILSQFVYGDRSLYTHLMLLLEEIIMTRPRNIIDYFDQYSYIRRKVKATKVKMNTLASATRLTSLFVKMFQPEQESYEDLDEENEFDIKSKLKTSVDIVDFIDYFEDMDVGLPKDEAFQISVAVRALARKPIVRSARFWGKIFGLEKSYIIAECDLGYEELVRRKLQLLASWSTDAELDEGMEAPVEETELIPPSVDLFPKLFNVPKLPRGEGYEGDEDWRYAARFRTFPKLNKYVAPPLPKPFVPKVIKTKVEVPGEGTNTKSYFVCNEPGEEWIPLPDVTPEQIVTARQIKRYFHGFLFKEIETYPQFPGKEREYLRAQIARISAGTQISPLGFYQFGGADEAGEGEGLMGMVPNLDFEPIPYQDLLTPDFWVHHAAHILTLGRTTWWDPKIEEMHEEAGEEENIKGESEPNLEPEIGPPLLTPLSEDITLEGLEPWTMYKTSKLFPGSGVVGVRSNLWPGAFAFAKERKFENIYIGWGVKHQVSGFTPYKQPSYQSEYVLGPEVMEIDDPSSELERAWAEAHKPIIALPPFGGEGRGFGENLPSPEYTEPSEDELD